MKTNLITLFAATAIFVSCETKEEPKNELEAAEMESEELLSGEADGPIAFNDGLVGHVDMSEVHLAELYDLDDQDVSGEEMEAAAKKIIDDLDERINGLEKVTPVGQGGQTFLDATIDQLKSTRALAKVYFDYSDDLAVPDMEWSDEMAEEWDGAIDALYEQYDNTFDALESAQSTYASYQDMDIIDSDVTIEDMYEQSKAD